MKGEVHRNLGILGILPLLKISALPNHFGCSRLVNALARTGGGRVVPTRALMSETADHVPGCSKDETLRA
jgi:hypothetical protein